MFASTVAAPTADRTGGHRIAAAHTVNAEAVENYPSLYEWLPHFLKEELRPHPGRLLLASRYTLAACLTMLFIEVFRIPGAATGGFFCLLLPRDSLMATFRTGLVMVITFSVALMFVSVGTILFVDYPVTHVLWVVVSFFLGFYCLSALTNYSAASAFAILIVIAVPQWDLVGSASSIFTSNLWVAGSVVLAVVCTIVVEMAFAAFNNTDQLQTLIEERLLGAAALLRDPASPELREKVRSFAVVGVSRLRSLALSRGTTATETARLTSIVDHVGRILDLAAVLESEIPAPLRPRTLNVAHQLETYAHLLRTLDSSVLVSERTPFKPLEKSHAIVAELESTSRNLALAISHSAPEPSGIDAILPRSATFFKEDAWRNAEHLRFALRGSAAALVCYLVMNAVAWPGISASLFTCVVTASTSIGSSRQRQLLRILGVLTGAVLIGLTGQVFILPVLDDFGAFAFYFSLVVFAASWIITASPRLSYFGTQLALGFFVVNLSTPNVPISLATSRNNIVGILLGLSTMWVFFETWGSRGAVQVMEETLARNFDLMADLSLPWRPDRSTDLLELRTMREEIAQNSALISQQADVVLFETGAKRQRSLALRANLLATQPLVRTLFLLEIATIRLNGEASSAARSVQIQFRESSRHVYQQLARSVRKGGQSQNGSVLPTDASGRAQPDISTSLPSQLQEELAADTAGEFTLVGHAALILQDLQAKMQNLNQIK